MATAGVSNNNMPASPGAGAGAERADPTAQCRPSRRHRLDVANTSAGSEEGAAAGGEEKVSTTPLSSGSDDRSVGAINVAVALLPGESQSGAVAAAAAAAASPVWFGSVALWLGGLGRWRTPCRCTRPCVSGLTAHPCTSSPSSTATAARTYVTFPSLSHERV
jgi:hypothetical protein